MLAGLIAAMLSVSIGILAGGIAGYYGGWVDEVLMRGGELFLALPWLYLLFAVRAALPLHISQWQVFLLLVSVMGLIGWARPARLIRGVVLSAKQRNFVVAARGFGASDAYLLRRHVLPQTYGVLLTQMTLLIPQYVLAEVTLTFLGLGVGEPLPSWGTLLSSLQQYLCAFVVLVDVPARTLLIPLFLVFYTAADALQELHKIRAAVNTVQSLLRIEDMGRRSALGEVCRSAFGDGVRRRACGGSRGPGERRAHGSGRCSGARGRPAGGGFALGTEDFESGAGRG